MPDACLLAESTWLQGSATFTAVQETSLDRRL